jgi:hypothetical protein
MRLTLVLLPLLLTVSTGCDDDIVQDAIPTSDAAHEVSGDAGTTSDTASEEPAMQGDSSDAAPGEALDAPTE